MDLLDIFYSIATEELMADCFLVQLVWESLGWLRPYSALPMTCWSLPCTCLSCPQPPGTSLTSSTPCLSHQQCTGTSLTSFTPCLSCPQPAGTSLTSSTPCLSCPQPAGTSLTSSTPCLSCPQLAEASPRTISSSDIVLLVLLSFLTEGGLFTLTVDALFGCDKDRVCYIGEEDPLAWCRSASGSHCSVAST